MHSTEKPVTGSDRLVKFTVTGEHPLNAPPPQFANFVAVSHAGTEVQFEFVFLDLNQIAMNLVGTKTQEKPTELQGQTVAKLVVPVAAFLQLKEHLTTMFDRLEEASHASSETSKETTHEGRRRIVSS